MDIAGAEIVGDRREDFRRDGEVCDAHRVLPIPFHSCQARTERTEVFSVRVLALVIEAVCEKFGKHILVYFRDVVFD